MSQTNNVEVDIKDFVIAVKKGFKKFLKTVIQIVLFYKQKRALFLILFTVGIVSGFFIEKQLETNKVFEQEIILEPKYEVNSYMYGLINSLDTKLKDTSFLREVALDSLDILYLKEVTLQPIINADDVLRGLYIRFNDEKYLYNVIENYDIKKLSSNKLRDFYAHHRLVLQFRKESSRNQKVSKALLEYVKKNKHFETYKNLRLDELSTTLAANKKTLTFIDQYLEKLNTDVSSNEKDVVVLANESEIPTITSLLNKKNELLNVVNEQERVLKMNRELFNVIEYGNIIPKKKQLNKRLIFLIPALLCGVVSFAFFAKYLSKKIQRYVSN